MRILVTAGNTFAPIDRVRAITNIFTGRTGARIAVAAKAGGHDVTLATSHPAAIPEIASLSDVRRFQTFDELKCLLAESVRDYDAVIHAAAVSDYLCADVFRNRDETVSRSGKIKSDEPELWLRLVRAPKLIDMIRGDWRFAGTLVKFKLEVGIDETALLKIAEQSRQQSNADLMVANTLEGAAEWALVGPLAGRYRKVTRGELPATLLAAIEECRRG